MLRRCCHALHPCSLWYWVPSSCRDDLRILRQMQQEVKPILIPEAFTVRCRTLRLSRCRKRERQRSGRWRQSAARRCSARVLAQDIALAGHAVFHVPSGSYGSLHAYACPTDHEALGPALDSLSSLASLGGLSARADRPETTPPGQS